VGPNILTSRAPWRGEGTAERVGQANVTPPSQTRLGLHEAVTLVRVWQNALSVQDLLAGAEAAVVGRRRCDNHARKHGKEATAAVHGEDEPPYSQRGQLLHVA